ncbi:MAG: hypothetical protein WCF85_22440, partial [Rhodospirillaceae bacterium]
MARRSGEAAGVMGRGSVRHTGRVDHRGGTGHRYVSDPLENAGWSRGKSVIAIFVLAVLAVLLGAGDYYFRGRNLSALTRVQVVWQPPGQTITQITAVEAEHWQAFMAARRIERVVARRESLVRARQETVAVLAPAFVEMKRRIPDYIAWFYSFPTTYRMAFTAVIAIVSKAKGDERSAERVATEAINRLLQDRFIEIVVAPEHFGPTMEAGGRNILMHAVEREQSMVEAEMKELEAFMAGQGPTGEQGRSEPHASVVVAADQLGLPVAAAAMMAAPPDAVQLIK